MTGIPNTVQPPTCIQALTTDTDEEDVSSMRLSTGHYIGLLMFAIVLPPAVILLCPRRDRWRGSDFRRALLYLCLLWVPAIVYASTYLNDAYRIGQGKSPQFFQRSRHDPGMDPNNPPTHDGQPIPIPQKSTSSHVHLKRISTPGSASHAPRGGMDAHSSTSSNPRAREPNKHTPPQDSRPPGTCQPPSQIQATCDPDIPRSWTLPFTIPIDSPWTYASEFRLNSRYAGHIDNCPFCSKCSKCAKKHVRYAQHRKQYRYDKIHFGTGRPSDKAFKDHSRENHCEEKHHVDGCCCRPCIGRGPPSGAGGYHVERCCCEICLRRRPKHYKVPKTPRTPYDRTGGVGMPFHNMADAGLVYT